MAAARSPPVSGSRAIVVLVAAEGLSADGWVVRVIGISKASQELSYTVTHCLGVVWTRSLGSDSEFQSEWVAAPTRLLRPVFS